MERFYYNIVFHNDKNQLFLYSINKYGRQGNFKFMVQTLRGDRTQPDKHKTPYNTLSEHKR